MRMNLACIDWVCYYYYLFQYTENVHREATSEYFVQDLRRPDRRTPMNVLTAKTYKFTDDIWKFYLQRNLQDIR